MLLEAHAHRFRAKLTGEEAGYRAAAVLFKERSLDFWLAVTLLEHGEAVEREPLLAEAREIFERLGATPWLERAGGAGRGGGHRVTCATAAPRTASGRKFCAECGTALARGLPVVRRAERAGRRVLRRVRRAASAPTPAAAPR